MQTARRYKEPSPRRKMIAAVHIQWKELRPDLEHPSDESRDERLLHLAQILRLKNPLDSLSELSDRQLGLVLDEFKRMRAQPQLPNCKADIVPLTLTTRNTAGETPALPGEVIHLLSDEQKFTATKLLDYLGWSAISRKAFIQKRFHHDLHFLRPKQAQQLMRILFNIACARDLKLRGAASVSRVQIREEIPKLKARLGIDRPRRVAEFEEDY